MFNSQQVRNNKRAKSHSPYQRHQTNLFSNRNQISSEAAQLFPYYLPNLNKKFQQYIPKPSSKIGQAAKNRRSKQFSENINQIISLIKNDHTQGNNDIQIVQQKEKKILEMIIPQQQSFTISSPQYPQNNIKKDSSKNKQSLSFYSQHQQQPNQKLRIIGSTERPLQNNHQIPFTLQQSLVRQFQKQNTVVNQKQTSNSLFYTNQNTNNLSDDALALIQKIEKKALKQIEILKKQKNQLANHLNEEISHHNQCKMRYIQLETYFNRFIQYLQENGIHFGAGNNIESNSHNNPYKQLLSRERSSNIYQNQINPQIKQRATYDINNSQRYVTSPVYEFNKHSQGIQGINKKNRVSSHFVSANKLSQKYTGLGANQSINQKDLLKDIQMRLQQAESQAKLYHGEIQKLRGSIISNIQFQQNIFDLLNDGQRIREDTIKLLKIKSEVAKTNGYNQKSEQLQRQLQQQQASKAAFFYDLKNFKSKYKELEQQNKKLKSNVSISPILQSKHDKRRKVTNQYQNMLEEMKRVTSG